MRREDAGEMGRYVSFHRFPRAHAGSNLCGSGAAWLVVGIRPPGPKKEKSLRVWLVLLPLLLIAAPVLGKEPIKLDLEKAVGLALERNLELKAKREEIGIAEARLTGANLFLQHNPELGIAGGNFKVSAGELALRRNLFNSKFSFSQELEVGGQPKYRRRAAAGNLLSVKLDVRDLERTVRFRVTELFLKLLSTEARIKQADRIVDLKTRLVEASRARLAAGDIPEVEVAIAEFGLNSEKSELLSLQREYNELLVALKTELALGSEQEVELEGELTPMPFSTPEAEVLRTALQNRPDLSALSEQRKVAQEEQLLARAQRVPNINIGVFYERQPQESGYLTGGQVSVPLPFYDRNQAEIREARARKEMADTHYANLLQTIEKQVQGAYERFKLSEKDLSLYPKGALKGFDDNLELTQRAYQEGQIDLSEALLFQDQVIAARINFIDVITNYNLSLTELKFQAGID